MICTTTAFIYIICLDQELHVLVFHIVSQRSWIKVATFLTTGQVASQLFSNVFWHNQSAGCSTQELLLMRGSGMS